jgi:hypothetical protein
MTPNPSNKSGITPGNLILGIALIILGIFFFFGQALNQVFNIRISGFTWPFTVILPGVLLYIAAFLTEVRAGRGLAVAGSVITAVGVLLFFQNVTGLWATWAYAWALVAPTAPGLGLALFGVLRSQSGLVREGLKIAAIGAIIFAVGATFFELLIGISGFDFFGLRGFCFPLVLIAAGLLFIVLNMRPRRKSPPPETPPSPADGQSE